MRPVELFVAVLEASNHTYAEATETQRSADFIASHSRAPVASAPHGRYFVRLRSMGACGSSEPSSEVEVIVPQTP